MDPTTSAILIAAAGQLLANGVERVGHLLSAPMDPEDAGIVGYPLLSEDDELITILSRGQTESLNEFLQDERTRAVVGTHAVIRLIFPNPSSKERRELDVATRSQFVDAGTEFGLPDVGIFDSLWDRITAQFDRMYVDRDFASLLTTDDRNALFDAQVAVVVDQEKRDRIPKWLRDLLDLASDSDRLREASTLASDVRRAGLAEFRELKLEHALEDVRRPLRDLYVHRSLQSPDGARKSTEDVLSNAYRSRTVVTGPPGAGKSTLTQNLLETLSSGENSRTVPLRVQVREMNLETNYLVTEIGRSIERDYQIARVSDTTIEDILTLGHGYVVFDGIDEILELGSRRRVIQRIEAFTKRFPMSSVLVTSRDVGYELASMNPNLFTRYQLLPFTQSEIEEYATKWFGPEDRGQVLRDTFLVDAGAVPDLCENPLMLSLLCTLYKARGALPRNRRHVYTQCADLLFNRWDSMRQIDQPTDHLDHGQDLMQDIALFFYNSSSAQRGIEDTQLERIIAQFLMDSAGVLRAHAGQRASKFLDFCAGRAWLLGKAGTSATGQRLFVFTHRTFMEFFAAEGMARSSASPQTLADAVVDAYRANPSSVVPELIVAAAEASRKGAARDILNALKDKEHLIGSRGEGRFLPLRLRIAAVLPLQPRILDGIIGDAFAQLAGRDAGETHGLFAALLALPRDPQARLVAHMLSPADVDSDRAPEELAEIQIAFMRAWIYRLLFNNTRLFDDAWDEAAEQLWSTLSRESIESSALLRHFAIADRRTPLDLTSKDRTWFYQVTETRRLLGLPVETLLRSIGGAPLDEVDERVCELVRSEGPPPGAPHVAMEGFETAVLTELERMMDAGLDPDRIEVDVRVRAIAVATTLLVWELVGEDVERYPGLVVAADLDMRRLGEIRDRCYGRNRPVLREQDRELLKDLVPDLGRWVEQWARGRSSFVLRTEDDE